MERKIGTTARGIRCPIIRRGDNLPDIVVDSILAAAECEGFEIRDRDVIGVTESVVARAQGNYAPISAIAEDVRSKFGKEKTIGVIFPILSRNRFAVCLRGIAMGAKKIVLMLSYPGDEVGNQLVSLDQLDKAGVNPYSDVLTLADYREAFGECRHEFTGIDYVSYYGDIIREAGAEAEIIFANNPTAILDFTANVLACDIHTRRRTRNILKNAGAGKNLYGLEDILVRSIDGCGYNETYGLLGSNKSTEDSVKLFPRDCFALVEKVQELMFQRTGKKIEVMIYGDGAFRDPRGQIWELADPVVSPAYTAGLEGTPNELKLKYLADNEFSELHGEELANAIAEKIRQKTGSLVGQMSSQGTTPRQLTDLIGSLCDLTSGSGDKGTPIILIQGYFDNYIS